ncbi:MAG: dipeptide ABC transporter ATP-binding protein [Calditrichota bacterium]
MQSTNNKLLEVRNLTKHFPVRNGAFASVSGYLRAVDGISLSIREGETLGLVGESGCGKTTTGRLILRLLEPTAGDVTFRGVDLLSLDSKSLRKMRAEMQIIFQDPYGSLNPRMSVGSMLGEGVRVHRHIPREEIPGQVADLLELVGLSPNAARRYPHEFSGGQRQRIGIARALSTQPQFIVCDEPVSALDVSVQAQVINLLQDLQERFGLTYLFISHDLSVVRHISNRVAVMYLGQIVELAESNALFERPLHPYTRALISAVPIPDPDSRSKRIVLKGEVPSPVNVPTGCYFHTRCPAARPDCSRRKPELTQLEPAHWVRCYYADQDRN